MIKLATIHENYIAGYFNFEIAVMARKKVVASYEDAVAWAEAEMKEGRDAKTEWARTEWPAPTNNTRVTSWNTPCNEEGYEEEWIMVVEDVE
jgi:hypothetical protein